MSSQLRANLRKECRTAAAVERGNWERLIERWKVLTQSSRRNDVAVVTAAPGCAVQHEVRISAEANDAVKVCRNCELIVLSRWVAPTCSPLDCLCVAIGESGWPDATVSEVALLGTGEGAKQERCRHRDSRRVISFTVGEHLSRRIDRGHVETRNPVGSRVDWVSNLSSEHSAASSHDWAPVVAVASQSAAWFVEAKWVATGVDVVSARIDPDLSVLDVWVQLVFDVDTLELTVLRSVVGTTELRRYVVIVTNVQHVCGTDVLDVADSLGLFGCKLSLSENGEEDCGKDCNDRDNDQKFNQSKCFFHRRANQANDIAVLSS